VNSTFWQSLDAWLDEQEDGQQEKVLADLMNIRTYASALSRPYGNTVKGSRHKNMKEISVHYGGIPVRAFFAFDPARRAIVFVPVIRVMTKIF
jgi:hypothetical protein